MRNPERVSLRPLLGGLILLLALTVIGATRFNNAGIIRAAGDCSGKTVLKCLHAGRFAAVTDNGTHVGILLK